MPDIKKQAAEIAKGMEFAVRFAPAVIKLRKASDANTGCSLSADEVKALIEGFQLLREGAKK